MSTAEIDLEQFAEALGLKTQMGREALRLALANVQLLDRKQQDYGSGNIAEFGEIGVLVRASDKVKRLQNLWKRGLVGAGLAGGSQQPQNESVADSWQDLANYGLIGQMVHHGLWR